MVNCELGCEKKTIFFFVLSRVWEKEKVLSTHKESNLRPSDSALGRSTTEPANFMNRM